MNVLDDFNREGLGIEVDFSLPAERVIRSLDRITEWRGTPGTIRVYKPPNTLAKRFLSAMQASPTGQWEVQDHATQWLWTYNNEHPNIPLTVCSQTVAGQRVIDGITPAMKLKMAA